MTIKLQKEITKTANITQCSCGFESEDMDYVSGYNGDFNGMNVIVKFERNKGYRDFPGIRFVSEELCKKCLAKKEGEIIKEIRDLLKKHGLKDENEMD